MISQPVAMGPSCHHTYPTLSILSEQDSTAGTSKSCSQQTKVARTTELRYNDKNSCHEHAQLQGFAEEGQGRTWSVPPASRAVTPKQDHKVAVALLTTLLQSTTNKNVMFCSTNIFLFLVQSGLALLEILNSSTHVEKIDKK